MKESVLFSDVTVLSADSNGQIVTKPHAFVAVKDGLILGCFSTEKEAREAFAFEPFALYPGKDRLLLPSFVNTHNHMAMTLLRNSADDLELHRWLFDVIFPREARLTNEMVAAGSRLALVEMIRSGTGASADMYYFHEETVKAALEAGFRLNFSVDVQSSVANQTLDENKLAEQMNRYTHDPSGLLRASMLVHSVYLYEPKIYPLLAELAKSLSCPVQVHVAETQKEVDECLEKHGRKPAAQLAHYGFFQTPTLAAHCVHLDDSERAVLARPCVFVSHCPASNLKLGSGIADVTALQSAGATVVLGTDGPASNNNLDLYRDMRLASFLAKGTSYDASRLPADIVLKMVTVDGMRALGFSDCGRIEAGWQADLQIVRTDGPEMTPLGNPVSAMVYSASSFDVESVMVAGRWLMKRQALKTLDEEKIRYEAVCAAESLISDSLASH